MTRGASEGLQVANIPLSVGISTAHPGGSLEWLPPPISHKVTSKAHRNSIGVTAGGVNMTDALARLLLSGHSFPKLADPGPPSTPNVSHLF